MTISSVAWDQEQLFIRQITRSKLDPIPNPNPLPPWVTAARAADSKKAIDIRILDLREVSSFADFFVICTGSNPRQIQAITEEIGEQLAERGEHPVSVEGFQNADWVLADYGDYLIHVFSAKARAYYDLERLWKHAKEISIPA
ncbi:MAG TPA: ribosome silencing factor [Bryobacteraceae bacterium]|nr:ribosome silencing factor [Bryobacteraceae bacterium]